MLSPSESTYLRDQPAFRLPKILFKIALVMSTTTSTTMTLSTPTMSRSVSSEDKPIKVEEEEQGLQSQKKPHNAAMRKFQTSNCADLSVALVSPGFSKQVLNDHTLRENIRLSLSVKNLQQDIIQKRLQGIPADEFDSVTKKAKRMPPNKLNLAVPSQRHTSHHSSARTAPIHGSFRRLPHHESLPTPVHSIHAVQMMRKEQPYARRRSTAYLPPLPHLPPLSSRLTPPDSAKLPSVKPLMHAIPPTPCSAHAWEKGRGEKEVGMNALSRAASLKGMKDDYLRACSMSFDAFHGIS